MNFDFEEWANLYKVDPDAFEVKRSATLERLLKSVDDDSRHALEQTLFRAEMTRRRAKSPLQGAIEASNLMWESFGKLQEQINSLEAAFADADRADRQNTLKLINPDQTERGQNNQTASAQSTSTAQSKPGKANVIQFPGRPAS